MFLISKIQKYEKKINYNIVNKVKRIDLFRQPIRMRTERSIKGRAYDEESGSFLGVTLTVFMFVWLFKYSLEVQTKANQGLLDNFSSQTIVNKYDEDSNDLKLFEFNFLPSIRIKTLSSTDDTFQSFKQHPSSEIYNFDNDDPVKHEFNYEKLDKYIKFYVKTRHRIKGVESHYRSKMVPCTIDMFKDNNL